MGRRKINDCERGSEAPQVLYSPLSYGDNLHYEKFADGSVKCIEDEIPFELPDGWAWSRLGAVAEAIGDGDHQPPPQTSFGVPFLVISNVSGGRLSFENTRFVSKEYFSQLPETRKPRNGDLLFTVTGSYGIPVLIDSDDKFCFQRHIAIVRPCTISNRYLYVILGSSYVKSICDAKATGTAQKTVGLATLRELLIPVAPYKEQMQIYAQTQDALSIVDSVSSDKEDLLNIIESAKTKILDLAIRGQLVPQDPTDEPASVLLERIRAEKEELIKQGKIKRDKKESVIFRGEDNSYYEKMADGKLHCLDNQLPFELPDGWEWCNLSMIGTTNIGLTYRPTDIEPGGIMVLRSCNIVNDQVDLSGLVRVKTTVRENQFAQKNDILICARNGSRSLVGKCALIPDLREPASFGAFMAIYRTEYFEFIVHYLRSSFFKVVSSLPPKKREASQLPMMVSMLSLYRALSWLCACSTRQAEISRLRMVAIRRSRFGICPIFAASSIRQRTWMGSLPPYTSSARSHKRLNKME